MTGSTGFPRTLRIGIVVLDDFEPLDVFGFLEAFSIARHPGRSYDDPPPYPVETVLIARHGGKVRSLNGPTVLADLDFAQALAAPPDVLMVPGGRGTGALIDDRTDPAGVAELLDWVRAMDGKVPLMTSVCTGAAILARAGLLDGRPAATNHAAFDWVARQGPKVQWDSVARWVDAGKYATSAGTSAGIDFAFYLVARLAVRAVAENAGRAAESDWQRDPQAPIHYPAQG
jgi:transcriptional regulator GlxA family with amidase domain